MVGLKAAAQPVLTILPEFHKQCVVTRGGNNNCIVTAFKVYIHGLKCMRVMSITHPKEYVMQCSQNANLGEAVSRLYYAVRSDIFPLYTVSLCVYSIMKMNSPQTEEHSHPIQAT